MIYLKLKAQYIVHNMLLRSVNFILGRTALGKVHLKNTYLCNFGKPTLADAVLCHSISTVINSRIQ